MDNSIIRDRARSVVTLKLVFTPSNHICIVNRNELPSQEHIVYIILQYEG